MKKSQVFVIEYMNDWNEMFEVEICEDDNKYMEVLNRFYKHLVNEMEIDNNRIVSIKKKYVQLTCKQQAL